MERNYILSKLVFIDDDPLTNQFHKMLIESMKVAREIECFDSAESILAHYSKTNPNRKFPDLFCVDIGLPKMNGHELAVALRQLPEFKEQKSTICFLTGSKDINDVIAADVNQFNHYFWKPLDKPKFNTLLKEVYNFSFGR
ncbi:MAG: response regulator [Flavobacteriales bacterium]